MQLELEGRTRAELEDVLQRIERHYRSEQAVRRRAEESEREAAGELARERELRVRLEEEVCIASCLPRARGLGRNLGAACNAAAHRLTCLRPRSASPPLRRDKRDGRFACVA